MCRSYHCISRGWLLANATSGWFDLHYDHHLFHITFVSVVKFDQLWLWTWLIIYSLFTFLLYSCLIFGLRRCFPRALLSLPIFDCIFLLFFFCVVINRLSWFLVLIFIISSYINICLCDCKILWHGFQWWYVLLMCCQSSFALAFPLLLLLPPIFWKVAKYLWLSAFGTGLAILMSIQVFCALFYK